jgi:hypothetical protein
VLPKLRSAIAFPASHSTYGALPTMNRFGFYPTLCFWMQDIILAPMLQFGSRKEKFARIADSSDFWLVLIVYLVVQFAHIHLHDGCLELAMYLKFQIA